MPNNNMGGANQFGGYEIQPGYGEVGQQAALTRESPMSGSPFAAQALNTPKRSGRQAKLGRTGASPRASSTGAPVTAPGLAPAGAPNPSPEAQAAQVWQAIAATPGASPLVQQYAQQAASGG